MSFRVGDRVRWSSQSGGRTKEKRGVVVRVVSAPQAPWRIAADEFPGHQRMFDGLSVPGGTDKGYLVEVNVPQNSRARPKLYLPYPSRLQHEARKSLAETNPHLRGNKADALHARNVATSTAIETGQSAESYESRLLARKERRKK